MIAGSPSLFTVASLAISVPAFLLGTMEGLARWDSLELALPAGRALWLVGLLLGALMGKKSKFVCLSCGYSKKIR